MTDSNAHSSAWGDKKTDSRGEQLEDLLILDRRLSLLNEGNAPTFVGAQGSSIIDLTLVSPSLLPYINHWGVHDEFLFSDHKLIQIHLENVSLDTRLSRKLRKADLEAFSADLAQKSREWARPEITSEKLLQEVVDMAKALLISSHAPLTPTKPKSVLDFWENDDTLDQKRDLASKHRKRFLRTKNPIFNNLYKEARQIYKNALQKAKQQSL